MSNTPINQEEIDTAKRTIENELNKLSISVYKTILENIHYSCTLKNKDAVSEACTENYRVIIKEVDGKRKYEYHPRIYDNIKVIETTSYLAIKRKECDYYLLNKWWYDKSSLMIFDDIESLVDFIIETHLF